MSAMVRPLIASYEAGAAITKGKAVKFSDALGKVVIMAAATTDKVVGIAQSDATIVGQVVEVAKLGGGAKALAKAAIAAGDRLGVNADGSIQKVATQGDSEFAQAEQDAAAGDIFGVMVKGNTAAFAAQS